MKLKINFADFWSGFDGKFFIWLFTKAGYQVEVSSNPDLLIYSVFGNTHKNYSCKKLYWTGENTRPPQDDFALCFDYSNNEKHFRFPLYAYQRWIWATGLGNLGEANGITLDTILDEKLKTKEELFSEKVNFCAFIQGNSTCTHRNEFFQALNSKKSVSSACTLFNNTGVKIGWEQKLQYIKSFKFMISFENTSYPGYVTEKIFEPMLVNTIPIYWGSDTVINEFNSKSYIDVNGLSISDAVDKVLSIDANDDLYYEMYKEPYLVNNELTKWLVFDNVIKFINDKVLI